MFVTSEILKSKHAFSTRIGGCSILEHTAEMNLAFGRGDDDETVLENIETFASVVGFDPHMLVSHPQIHSDIILKAGKENAGEGYYIRDGIQGCDGYITNEKGVVLGIKTADCVPILFEALKADEVVAIGAVHAGWRGTVARIAEKCVSLLCREYGVLPQDIRAVIGPCIHSCCYEVGEDLLESVRSQLGDEIASSFVVRDHQSGKLFCDLTGINHRILTDVGISKSHIEIMDMCTCCMPKRFYSHRFSGGLRGTMLNVICM